MNDFVLHTCIKFNRCVFLTFLLENGESGLITQMRNQNASFENDHYYHAYQLISINKHVYTAENAANFRFYNVQWSRTYFFSDIYIYTFGRVYLVRVLHVDLNSENFCDEHGIKKTWWSI